MQEYFPISTMNSMLMTSLDSMKSNRRKQSKPIRVSNGEGELLLAAPVVSASTELSIGQYDDLDNVNEEDSPTQDYVLNACDKCTETFTSPEALTAHVTAVHCQSEASIAESSFPTKYHQLGNELNKESGYSIHSSSTKTFHDANRNNVECSVRYSPDEPSFRDLPNGHVAHASDEKSDPGYEPSADSSNNEALMKSDGTRIFHQDAYCELCDREFCNKYFLKTHRANKHNIFDDSYPLIGSSVSHSPDSIISNGGLCVSPGVQTTLSSAAAALNITSTLNDSSLFKGVSKVNSDISAISAPGPLPTTPSKPEATPSSNTTATPNITPSDMEDYCEICQKHFCNKYYLKRHKQDVHGIAPETPSMSRRRPIIDSLPSMIPNTTTTSLILPQGMNNLSNVMVLNPFVPPVAILQAPPFLQPPFTSQPGMSIIPPHSLPMTSLPMTSLPIASLPMTSLPMSSIPLSTLPSSTPQPSDQPVAIAMAPSPNVAANDSLRNIGVLNAEAYCDICRKEFCNKYFLKIHKANKHGIFTEDMPNSIVSSSSIAPPGLPENFFRYSGNQDPAQALVESIFRATSKLENANAELQRQNKAASPTDTSTFCTICNSEFSSKYSYKIHKMSVHGILTDDPPADDKLEPGQVSVSSSSQFIDSNAKNVDPIKCEICYKQLNGKHSLRNHMVKYHGAELDIKLEPKIKTESMPSSNSSQKENGGGEQVLDNDLVKIGFDPETYCDICKKEFCSKFFLKTHILNVHNIKSPKGNSDPDSKGVGSPVAPSAVGTLQRLAEANAMNMNNSSPLNLSNSSSDYDSFEKSSWRWKEPQNSSRVTCDICNRELCNKYFLKTHKFNKHGISFENQRNAPASRTSPNYDKSNVNQMQSPKPINNLVKDERRSQTIQKLSESLKTKSLEEESYNSLPHVCNFCSKRFTTNAALQAHLVKEHALLNTPNYSIERMLYASLPPNNFDFKLTPKEGRLCNLCKKTFVDTLALQLHLIQEHNAQVQLQPEVGNVQGLDLSNPRGLEKMKTKVRLYSCSHCDYTSKWLPNIYSHEEKKHNITKASRSNFQCSMCTKTFLYEHSLIRHLRDYHQQSESASDDQTRKVKKIKSMKCTHCKDSFATLYDCIKHIRHEHIQRGTSVSQRIAPARQLFCYKCSFSTRFPRIMRQHKARYHRARKTIVVQKSPQSNFPGSLAPVCQASPSPGEGEHYEMQPFTLQTDHQDTTFVESRVRLPVRVPVKNPVTVTFTLTPLEQ